MHGGTLLQQWDGFFAKRAVVVDQGDLFALELVGTTLDLDDVLHDHVGSHPVGTGQREVPLEHATVLAFRTAIACCHQRNFVVGGFFGQRKRDAGGQRLEHGGSLALQALVALHAPVGGVAGFAFFIADLHTVDTAALVDELEVVHIAIGERHTVGRIGPGAVHQHGEKLLFGLGCRLGGHQGPCEAGGDHAGSEDELTNFHGCLLKE